MWSKAAREFKYSIMVSERWGKVTREFKNSNYSVVLESNNNHIAWIMGSIKGAVR